MSDTGQYYSMSNVDLPLSCHYSLSRKCCLLFTPAAYIHEHFRVDFIMEANTMIPDQTAPLGLI